MPRGNSIRSNEEVLRLDVSQQTDPVSSTLEAIHVRESRYIRYVSSVFRPGKMEHNLLCSAL